MQRVVPRASSPHLELCMEKREKVKTEMQRGGLEARGTSGWLEARGPGGPVHAGWRSRGYLPHFDSNAIVQHIVFRLADALPRRITGDLGHCPKRLKLTKIDEALDKGSGMHLLAQPPVAEIVENVLLHFDSSRYRLFAWCVMPTHVHVLAEQLEGYPLSQVIHSWKSFSANAANRKLQRRGAFWAPEYYDRFMRDADQFETTHAYIENNPVAAGLCSAAQEWRFSSASKRR